ncbi:MAG: 3-deoxy-D-manno-octulosonic acid transferase, partial [Gillisia sp.]
SGSFRKDQLFFKPYGSWMINSLKTFEYFFVQNHSSAELLKEIGFNNVAISGDTRFDRVVQQLKRDNQLDFIEEFKGDKFCLVTGSTWPEDENLLLDFITSEGSDIKTIIAPHTISRERIKKLQENLKIPSVLFSEKEGKDLSEFPVLILDTIGLLSRVYYYADVAYVGGAAGKTGLHNILEPATFGIPIIIGKNFKKFPEAEELQKQAGLFSVATPSELTEVMQKFIQDNDFRSETGIIVGRFIDSNTGASQKIAEYFEQTS